MVVASTAASVLPRPPDCTRRQIERQQKKQGRDLHRQPGRYSIHRQAQGQIRRIPAQEYHATDRRTPNTRPEYRDQMDHQIMGDKLGIRDTRPSILQAHAQTFAQGLGPARWAHQEAQRTPHAAAYREDRLQRLPLRPKSTRYHQQQMPLRIGSTNSSARPLTLPSTPPTPGPGTGTTPRTQQSPEATERAQCSRQGNQVHRTDSDPWAISGSRP
ncbi:Spliceosome-associated protein 49 [Fusarium oxysporum f. sp. albedinis]|nr:Spliceosome-associated protein 49 [Fusarium oxysporum f. sp. albedinis]